MNQIETLLIKLFINPSKSYTNPRFEGDYMLEHFIENIEKFDDLSLEELGQLMPRLLNNIASFEDESLRYYVVELDHWMEEYKYVQTEYQENDYDIVFNKMLWSVLDKIDEIVNRCEFSY